MARGKAIVREAMLVLALILPALLCCSCSRRVNQCVQDYRSDSSYYEWEGAATRLHSVIDSLRQTAVRKDSIVIRDSVVVVVNDSGKVITKEVYRTTDRSRFIKDELEKLRAENDSISSMLSQLLLRKEDNQVAKETTIEKTKYPWKLFTFLLLAVFVFAGAVWARTKVSKVFNLP